MNKITNYILFITSFIFPFQLSALDCSPLNPSGVVVNSVDAKIEGAAKALFKLGKFDGKISGKVNEEITNVFNSHPDANETTVKNRLIYLYCEMLGNSKDISEMDKFDKLNQLSDKILQIKIVSKNYENGINIDKKDGFVKKDCGSIVDTNTGLEWFIGPNFNMNWQDSVSWVKNLNTCGVGWRLPNKNEIQTLHDPEQYAGIGYFKNGKFYPSKINRIFNAIGNGSWVWIEGKVIKEKAPAYNLYENIPVKINQYNTKYTTRAFAVKSTN